MTDEEKAEEYVNTHCCYYRQDFIRAYLDGLAEGRKTKWHDLRKNPEDLPKESGEYWCKWDDGTYCTAHYFLDYGFGDYTIAWCELTEFEE